MPSENTELSLMDTHTDIHNNSPNSISPNFNQNQPNNDSSEPESKNHTSDNDNDEDEVPYEI